MPLKTVRGLWNRIGVQLTLWYTAIFILSSIGLFILSYFLLSTSLQKKDKEFILSRLNEYAARYNAVGPADTIKEIEAEARADGYDSYFVRLADVENKTLYKTVPDHWLGFDTNQLDSKPVGGNGSWLQLMKKGGADVLEIRTQRLQDGRSLQVGLTSQDRNKVLQRFLDLFTSVLAAVVLIGIIGGSLVALRVLRPIRLMVNTARTIIDTGKLDSRVPSRLSGDELDELAVLFNQMLEKIKVLIEGMSNALDNVAHDLRTPLTRLRNIAESALQADHVHESCQNALADCLEESDRVLTMLKTLMDISEAETGVLKLNLERLEVSPLIEDVVDLYQHVMDEKNIRISTSLSSDLWIQGDKTRMRQVFANLLDNAVKYTPVNGSVSIRTTQANDLVSVFITDSGVGIPSQEIPKIWARLYRGDQSRSEQGLGLGLSLVCAIVKSHSGWVQVSSEVQKGSCFTVVLPNMHSSLNLGPSRSVLK